MRLVAVVLFSLLGLTACAAESEGGATGGSGSGSAGQESNKNKGDSGTSEQSIAGKDCLVGTWLGDNEFFLTKMQELGDEPKSVTGDVVLTFDRSGALTTKYQGWRILFVAEGREITLNRSGVDKGTWSANDKTVSIKETDMESTLKMTGPGMSMSVPSDPVDYRDVAYTCTATNASITTSDGVMQMTRR